MTIARSGGYTWLPGRVPGSNTEFHFFHAGRPSAAHGDQIRSPLRASGPGGSGPLAPRPVARRPVREAHDEPEGRPGFVDRAAFVVDEARREADTLDALECDVGGRPRGFLRVRDPEPAGRVQRALQHPETPGEDR